MGWQNKPIDQDRNSNEVSQVISASKAPVVHGIVSRIGIDKHERAISNKPLIECRQDPTLLGFELAVRKMDSSIRDTISKTVDANR